MRYRLSDRARQDLDEIWSYIAEDGLRTADRFIDAIIDRIRAIADQPGIGRTRNELAASLRSFPVGNYLIFYRPLTDGVEVVRILSGFRDLPPLFDTSS